MDIKPKIRIKDIADLAGVSVGTVDRVIHGRTNVSPLSMEKVQRVLDEIDFHPNHYYSALAKQKKTSEFAAILPLHAEDSYWARVEHGLIEGTRRFTDFNVSFKIFHYDPFNDESFKVECNNLLEAHPDVAIVGPIFNYNIMKQFVGRLNENNIPFALLDSYWEEFKPVTFYGQDSIRSGEFAGRIIRMATAGKPQNIALFKVLGEGRVASRQQLDREDGFRRYMKEHCPQCKILTVNLYAYDKEGTHETLRTFFADHPEVITGLSFNSSIHLVSDYLRTEKPDHAHVTLLGYEATIRNVECIKNGSCDFIIAQHPYDQGLNCFRSMFNACVLNISQKPLHYVSIELLTKENIDYYKD